MGIRGRIALAISFVTALAVVVLGLSVHHISAVERAGQAQSYQDSLLSSALQVYQRDSLLALGAQLDDSTLPPVLMEAVREGRSGTYISGGGDPRVWAATEVDGGKVLSVSAPYPDRDPLQRALDKALVVAGAATVALMAVVAWFVAQSLSRRLRHSAAAARRIAAGEPPDPEALAAGGRDEVAELGRSVHHMATSLAARVEAEREFTADVAHELRTPVAGLVASAELLPHPRAVEMVRERAQTMRVLVEDLLEVSRLDAGRERAQLDEVELPSLVRGIVKRAQGQRGVDEVSVEVVGEGRIVATDARRVERILVNVLGNAAKHGKPPIEVLVEGTRITVRDHGDGYPPELVDQGPRRFRTAAPERGTGHGLGLTIAVGQAVVLGARLEFGSAEGGGAQVVLDLPEAEPPTAEV
ncbi:histidine kinase [Streptomyces eurocidicus]|uniref:histidine kinase n=1 Tax=Streptomyces eurocidicus TaxID=66423 RepID=A0A2N8P3E6_STREU|nr:HAMP domain-containing sensor histidine kinase [Streptomyces eurocidicus]MBB5117744.1 signal transduction histidine kinase [Streptomyces eurocidicus]MBF6053578.1 HAMP domain-containing protein [Streptomyces eurocidicus]PNE35536.1 histidine kinase [Streptomyces eurocidicus]